jgi:hypothetical protein
VGVLVGKIGAGVSVGSSNTVAVQTKGVCVGSGDREFPMNCGRIEITAAIIVPATPRIVSWTLLSAYHFVFDELLLSLMLFP